MTTKRRALAAIALMLNAVAWAYWRPKPPGTVQGLDFSQFHVRRLQFAREALLGPSHTLPGWYPRELFGSPFWSNIQDFPFIPTRLPLLLLDPTGPFTYTIAFTMAAALAALFTYLFCRRVGLGMTASAVAGWTFACSGFFAARVFSGHLSTLDVYCALPLLLWVAESLIQAHHGNRPIGRWIAALAAGSCFVVLAGHPQIPAYAIAASTIYLIWRLGIRRAFPAIMAIALGIGCAAIVLVPAGLLIARSTRVLPLAIAENDIPMPYGRLSAFLFPWIDGAPQPMQRADTSLFHGYPGPHYFWDTVCYVGWMPWVAVLLWLICGPKKSPLESPVRSFILLIGLGGILFALPPAQQLTSDIHATLMRSPARLLYLTQFSLAIAMGVAIQLILTRTSGKWPYIVAIVAMAIHGVDLRSHVSEFVAPVPIDYSATSDAIAPLLTGLGDDRIAIDNVLTVRQCRATDDVGFFDSILLARSYRTLLDLSGQPRDLNVEAFDGSELTRRALEAAGVRFVVTYRDRADLKCIAETDLCKVFAVPNPSPRAVFYGATSVQYLPVEEIHQRLGNDDFDVAGTLLLPGESPRLAPTSQPSMDAARVNYSRPGPDQIDCDVACDQPGYLRLLESWDPGWSAIVDGTPVKIEPALDAFIAVPLTAGQHQVHFMYHTPGVLGGTVISIACVIGVALLTAGVCRRKLNWTRLPSSLNWS